MSTNRPTRPRRARRLALALGLALAALVAAEGLARVWLRLAGEPYGAWRTETEILRTVAAMVQREPVPGQAAPPPPGAPNPAEGTILHPYFAFERLGGLDQVAQLAQYYESGADEDAYEVLLVGGSVAAGFGNQGDERFVRRLQEDPRFAGRPVRLVKFARGAFKEPQQVMIVGYLLALGFRFDAVLSIDGFNEVALANMNAANGTHPVYPSIPQWGPVAHAGVSDRATLDLLLDVRAEQVAGERLAALVRRVPLCKSALFGRALRARLHTIQRAWVQAQERYLAHAREHDADADAATRGPRFRSRTGPVLAAAVRAWMESSRVLQAICDARSMTFLDVLQPTLHDPGSKPLTADEVRTGKAHETWVQAVQLGYPLLRAGGARLREEGVGFADASMVFAGVEETLYVDACHFGQAGNEILADFVAQAFLAALPE